MRCLLFVCGFLINFSLFAQSEQLAKNYFDQGEYEKALKTYERLAKTHPANANFFFGIVSSHQQLENYKAAEVLLFEKLENSANRPHLFIELGHNFQLQQDESKAEEFYEEALRAIEARPNYAYSIARSFEKYSLIDYAVLAYEKGMEFHTDQNFNLQLARLYGEQGKTEKMFKNYLDLISSNPDFFGVVSREFSRYISDDPQDEGNVIFRKLLLQRLQKEPLILYNELLSWLFSQQKQFDRAFVQEKAIYKRGEPSFQGLINLTLMAKEAGDYEAAKEAVSYIIEEAASENILLQAHQHLMDLKTETADADNLGEIEKEYQELFEKFGTGIETLALQIDYANFSAFQLNKKQEAVELLKELTARTDSKFDEAVVKMALADILVLEEKFNEALIYYSQVQKLVKNNEISQEARFKVAKTSYYKGDFDWAKTQLDVLKSSTSQLIANDAMELSLLIEDNSIEDTAQTALKLYAKADLLSFQQKNKEAILILDEILTTHKGEKIEDETLLKQALIYEQEKEFLKAESNYLNIIENHNEDILADNANYYLANLYANDLQEPKKAKNLYEKIIFNFADSIYFVEARKKYRELRGDDLE